MHKLEIAEANARVFHNSDWSGDARVLLDVGGPDQREVRIPGNVLIAIGRAAAEEKIKRDIARVLDL
jgi:hypothetical protein